MPLLEDVRRVLMRLGPLGWSALLARHGLDLAASDLVQELSRDLTGIDRSVPGFEDFSLDGRRAIEPGRPGDSLLLHALSSAYVHPTADGSPAPAAAYPTLEELDLIENYVFAVARRRITDFPNAVIAVFAYQYRPGTRSPHRVHADMAYSRAGIARVGTAPANYLSDRRCFWVRPTGNASSGIAVMPARYAAFLAEARHPSARDEVATIQPEDNNKVFLFPVHKLFEGSECLVGSNLQLQFHELHHNDKLQRVHTQGQVPLVPGFDVNQPPFVRDSRNTEFVKLQRRGASVLVVPTEHAELSRPALQRNASTGREEYVRFKVPKDNGPNRFYTSLAIPAINDQWRRAPEYVNIRHRVDSPVPPAPLFDINTLPAKDFTSQIREGNYEAAHFIDDCAEGALSVDVQGLAHTVVASRAAYSLVAAPDFFPLADQLEITEWVRRVVPTLREHYAQGRPEPLSFGRRAVNPSLNLPPPRQGKAFERRDITLMAIVGAAPWTRTQQPTRRRNVLTTYLTDGASNEFAPGWDVSVDGDAQGDFYSTYGLGSPFPEDAKLCAALNSYWPAVAPDAARTFGILHAPTATPLLDAELGLHPDAGNTPGQRGWDGEYGPFLQTVLGQRFVNHASIERSDYVRNTRQGALSSVHTEHIDGDELISRMEALRTCIRVLPPNQDRVATTRLLLVSLTQVKDWAAAANRGDPRLTGAGYRFVFAELEQNARQQATEDVTRVLRRVVTTYECQTGQGTLCWRQDEGDFEFLTEG